MSKVLISGGSGLLGRTISLELLKNKIEVVWLSRKPGNWRGIQIFEWNPSKNNIDLRAFEGVDCIIHLAGEGIIEHRWTRSYKEALFHSRVDGLNLLHKTITENNFQIKTLIGASAIGYYGFSESDHLYFEDDSAGSGFVSELCEKWERAYTPFENAGIRTVVLRIGIVLSKEGGFYAKLAPIYKIGLGMVFGSGRAFISWIHIQDLAAMFLFSIESPQTRGIFNAVAPEPANYLNFSKLLAKSLGAPFFLKKLPAFLLRLFFNERSDLIYKGAKVSNEKIKSNGFIFKFTNLDSALKSLAH